jgi:hypothetical protein
VLCVKVKLKLVLESIGLFIEMATPVMGKPYYIIYGIESWQKSEKLKKSRPDIFW